MCMEFVLGTMRNTRVENYSSLSARRLYNQMIERCVHKTRSTGANKKIRLSYIRCVGTEIKSVIARNWKWEKGTIQRDRKELCVMEIE